MSDTATARGSHAPSGAGAARQALVDWVRAGGAQGREFLQVHLRALEDGRFRVVHLDDQHLPAVQLEQVVDPYAARIVAQTTADGAHRPLKTAPNLRRGWRFESLDERGLWTVLDYLYPACVAHWHAGREGTLRVTHWADTAGRQSGMYSSVRLLPESALEDVVSACCDRSVCLRRVAWGADADTPLRGTRLQRSDVEEDNRDGAAIVPCPEACSMFISFARAVLAVERSPRTAASRLGPLNALEVQQIRELVASAAEGSHEGPREGEFDQPLNGRRLRYLAIRLGSSGVESDGSADDAEL